MQFLYEIIFVISIKLALRVYEITRMLSDQTAFHSVQLPIKNCSPLSPIIHAYLHLIRALFVFSLVKMDNVRQGQRMQIVQNLLTRANEQITKYRRVKKNYITLFSKYLENRSKIVRYNLQFYYLLHLQLRYCLINCRFADLHQFLLANEKDSQQQ